MINAILDTTDNAQVIIVDDNSPDGTGQISDNLARQHPDKIHVIHRYARGRGTAGITGFKYALTQDADCVIEMDADFSHDPKYIPEFLKEIEQFDIVIGSRFISNGKAIRNPIRKLISTGANIYTRLLLGREIHDWCGGYKCYRKEALASLNFSDFYSTGYSIGAETLYRLIKGGYSHKEIPIIFVDEREGKSKFSVGEILKYIVTVFKLKWALKRA
jgi:dolichol-phosphate mannosyltransferase